MPTLPLQAASLKQAQAELDDRQRLSPCRVCWLQQFISSADVRPGSVCLNRVPALAARACRLSQHRAAEAARAMRPAAHGNSGNHSPVYKPG